MVETTAIGTLKVFAFHITESGAPLSCVSGANIYLRRDFFLVGYKNWTSITNQSAYRMDYVVKESGNSYIAAVTSHTSYWCNRDIAFFVLTKIFPELEHVPVPPNLTQ